MHENPYESPSSHAPSAPGMRSLRVWGIGLGVAHLLICFLLFVAVGLANMHRFDNGGDPAQWEQPARLSLAILAAPGWMLMSIGFPALVQNAIAVANSALWGFGLAWLGKTAMNRFHA